VIKKFEKHSARWLSLLYLVSNGAAGAWGSVSNVVSSLVSDVPFFSLSTWRGFSQRNPGVIIHGIWPSKSMCPKEDMEDVRPIKLKFGTTSITYSIFYWLNKPQNPQRFKKVEIPLHLDRGS
jgi:hypothetical protein